MNNKYVYAADKGICEFCGQPIEFDEKENFVRVKREFESRICHEECYEEYREDKEENK